MDMLAEILDAKLREWKPNTAVLVREWVAEIIDLADSDVLEIMQSRSVEQEVLDLLNESITRWNLARGSWLGSKNRPAVVVSRYDPNPLRAIITYDPLTTQYRQSSYEVVLPKLKFLNQDS